MSIYKRGEAYWYKFMWMGKLVREFAKQGNDKVARQMEAAHCTSLAKGEVGIREKKQAPTLAEFAEAILAVGRIHVRREAQDVALLSERSATAEGLRAACIFGFE